MNGSAKLRDEIRARAENRPGVYRIYGSRSELIYVGKSVKVRTRLLSYFRASEAGKAHRVIEEAEGADWEYTPDEFSALVREMKLIQRHRPRFNVQHKRKRSYAFVKITGEPAPRVLVVSRVVPDGSVYFGPYAHVEALRSTVRELAHVLGIRDCAATMPMYFADQPDIFGWAADPGCIRAELGSCMAPCCGRCDEAGYRGAIEKAADFLSGHPVAPLEELQDAMLAASDREEFEYAAFLRDRHRRLRAFAGELAAFRGQVEALSFIYRVVGHDGKTRLYLIRGGRVRQSIPESDEREGGARMARAVSEVFGGPNPELAALEPEEAAEILLVARWFRLRPDELANTVPPNEWRYGASNSNDRAVVVDTRPRSTYAGAI